MLRLFGFRLDIGFNCVKIVLLLVVLFTFLKGVVDMNDVATQEMSSASPKVNRTPVDDETFAIQWTKIITNGGTVLDVSEALGLSKEYTQQRSVQLRKDLREYNVELPKAKGRQRRKKSLDTVAEALTSLMATIDELDEAAVSTEG